MNPKSKRDPRLKEKLRDELPGVLNWALDGLDRLLEQGGFTGDRSPMDTRDTWEEWGSSLGKFLSAATEREPEGRVEKQKLYDAYLRFCRDRGVPSISSQQKFTREITGKEQIGQANGSVGGKKTRLYTGLEVL